MEETKQITLRIEKNLYEEVKNLAKSESRPVSKQIEYIIKKYLEIRK